MKATPAQQRAQKKYRASAKGKAYAYRRNRSHRARYVGQTRRFEKNRRERRRRETLAKATFHYQPWTDVEDAFVVEFSGTLKSLALALGRTYYSVQQRRKKLRAEDLETAGNV